MSTSNFHLYPKALLLRCGSRGEHRSYPGCAGPRRRWWRRARPAGASGLSRRSPFTAKRSRATSKAIPPIARPRSICLRAALRSIDAFLSSTCCTATADETIRLRPRWPRCREQRQLAAAQGFSSAIVVTPNAFTLHKGSMYSNSPTIGDWERFIAEDLASYMDTHYRTSPIE